MHEQEEIPHGKLILRTLAMPADTNANGDIFGGWIMSQMDIAGSIYAKEVTKGRTLTVAVEFMKFIKPVRVGDIVSCYGSIQKIGNTSITLNLTVWVEPILRETEDEYGCFKATEAAITYLSIDKQGKKKLIDKSEIEA